MISERNKKSFAERRESFGAWTAERRADLTRKIALLAVGISLFYIGFDAFYGAYEYLPYYSILLLGSGLCLGLLKYKVYTAAKISLLISGLVLLSILASWETRETGVFMYFLVVALASITLFGAEEKYAALIIGLLTFSAFYIVYFTNLLDFQQLELDEEYIRNSLLINYSICLVATITMVYYILSIGYQYEHKMHGAQNDLMQITRKLDESRSKFELAIKGSSAGIWDWDIMSNKLFISEQLMKLLGFNPRDRADIEEEEFMSYLHPQDLKMVNDHLSAHLKKKKKFEVECRVKKKDGDYIWVLNTGQAEWNGQGKGVRMVGSIVDISERKAAEDEVYQKNAMLRKTNEELDRFVYSTSHDLRAPLSSLIGLVNIAELTNDPEEQKRCLQLMVERINTLNGFIADIISYSRNTRLDVLVEQVNLGEMVDVILASLEYFENQKAIQIEKNYPEDFIFKCDKSRLRIILNNLISNAIKYHNVDQDNPLITISTHFENGMVEIKVEDNGSGIEESFQSKIFEMFYRATEKSEGSGLGLYIAREMTEKLNGQLTVESESGVGSTFTLTLPTE